MKGDVQGTASKTLQWTANGAGLSPVVLLARPSMVNPAAIMVKGRKEKKKQKTFYHLFFCKVLEGHVKRYIRACLCSFRFWFSPTGHGPLTVVWVLFILVIGNIILNCGVMNSSACKVNNIYW